MYTEGTAILKLNSDYLLVQRTHFQKVSKTGLAWNSINSRKLEWTLLIWGCEVLTGGPWVPACPGLPDVPTLPPHPLASAACFPWAASLGPASPSRVLDRDTSLSPLRTTGSVQSPRWRFGTTEGGGALFPQRSGTLASAPHPLMTQLGLVSLSEALVLSQNPSHHLCPPNPHTYKEENNSVLRM